MELIPLAGDVAMLVEAGGQLVLIPRPSCEDFSLLVIDHGPSEPEKLSGILTIAVRLGPDYVGDSLAILNSRRLAAGQPALSLPAQLLCRLSALLPVPIGPQSSGAEAVDVVLRPGARQTVQFRLGRDIVTTTLALMQVAPAWTPQVNVSALLKDPVPLSVRTSLEAVEVRRQRIRNSLLVTVPAGAVVDSPDFVVVRPDSEDRYLVPHGGVTIDTLPREPFDYYVEWATDGGVTNVVPGRLPGWSSDEVTYLKLPVASRTVKISPTGLDKVGASARLFLLVLGDSGGGLRLATFEDEDRADDVLQRILCEAGTELTRGILVGFDEAGSLTGVRAADANDVVGFPTVFVSVLDDGDDPSALLTSAAGRRWRHILGVAPGGDAEAAYEHYFPALLKNTFPGLDPGAPPAPGWLASWASHHNRSGLDHIRAAFPLLYASASLGQAAGAADALLALDAVQAALASSQEPAAGEVAGRVVASFLARASSLSGFGPAVIRACLGFPAALKSITEPRTLLAIGRLLEEPKADALDVLVFDLYSRAAASGNLEAKTALGTCNAEGRGVERDVARAESLFREASALPDAKYQLGRLLLEKGDPFSVVEGVDELSDAAAANSIDAMVTLGLIYELGDHGITRNFEKARQYYAAAVTGGNVRAKCQLGLIYLNGLGTPADTVAAAPLLRDAALAGVAEAQFAYAGMLAAGIAASPTSSVGPEHFFRLAARQGHAPAVAQALLVGGLRLAEIGIGLAAPPSSFQDSIARYAVTLARLGKTARAGDLAATLSNASLRWNASVSIAEAAAKLEDFEGATVAAEAIEDATQRDRARVSIARARIRANQLAEAATLITTVGDPFYREWALTELAHDYAKAGRLPEAKAVVAQITHPFQKELALAAIAGGLSLHGDFASATEVVQDIKGGHYLVNVAWAQYKAGDKAGALLTAGKIQNSDERGRAYGGIARLLLDAGAVDEARDVALLGPQASFDRAAALYEVVVAYAKMGEFAKAASLLLQIPAGQQRNGATGSLAILQAQGGEVDQALALASAVPDDDPMFGTLGDSRPDALGAIASLRLQSQGVQAALAVLEKINNPDARRIQVYLMARARAEIGDVAGAGGILDGLPDHPGKKDGINKILSLAAASAGQYQSAVDRVNQIEDSEQRSVALLEVVSVMARAGEFVKARELSNTLEDSGETGGNLKSYSLSRISVALFMAGRIEEALQTADSIPANNVRASTHSELRQSIHKLLTAEIGFESGVSRLGSTVAAQSKDDLIQASITLAEKDLASQRFKGVIDNLDRAEAIAYSSAVLAERVDRLSDLTEAYSRLLESRSRP